MLSLHLKLMPNPLPQTKQCGVRRSVPAVAWLHDVLSLNLYVMPIPLLQTKQRCVPCSAVAEMVLADAERVVGCERRERARLPVPVRVVVCRL